MTTDDCALHSMNFRIWNISHIWNDSHVFPLNCTQLAIWVYYSKVSVLGFWVTVWFMYNIQVSNVLIFICRATRWPIREWGIVYDNRCGDTRTAECKSVLWRCHLLYWRMHFILLTRSAIILFSAVQQMYFNCLHNLNALLWVITYCKEEACD